MTMYVTKERYDDLVALHEKCLAEKVPPPTKKWFRTYCPQCNERVRTKRVPLVLDGLAALQRAVVDLTECSCGYHYGFGYTEFID